MAIRRGFIALCIERHTKSLGSEDVRLILAFGTEKVCCRAESDNDDEPDKEGPSKKSLILASVLCFT